MAVPTSCSRRDARLRARSHPARRAALRGVRSARPSTHAACWSLPGLINTHLHLGTNAAHTFFLDETKADYFGANFYAYSVPRRGAADARAATRPDVEAVGTDCGPRFAAGRRPSWTSARAMPPNWCGSSAKSARACTWGRPSSRFTYAFDEAGRIQLDPDKESGLAGLERAVAFAAEHDGAHDGTGALLLLSGPARHLFGGAAESDAPGRRRERVAHLAPPAMNMVEFTTSCAKHGRRTQPVLVPPGAVASAASTETGVELGRNSMQRTRPSCAPSCSARSDRGPARPAPTPYLDPLDAPASVEA